MNYIELTNDALIILLLFGLGIGFLSSTLIGKYITKSNYDEILIVCLGVLCLSSSIVLYYLEYLEEE